MVIRTIPAEIPDFTALALPEILKEIVMTNRGLVLVVGATGSGKSTSLAAMIDHRNRSTPGHIITVEDPASNSVHQSHQSLVTHREVGTDTHSLAHHALKKHPAPGAGRHSLIGEIRDAETMEHAVAFAETGRIYAWARCMPTKRQPDHRPHHQFLFRGAAQAAADGSCRAISRPSFLSA